MKRYKTQKTRSEEIPRTETKPNGELLYFFILLPKTENNHSYFVRILVSQA